MVMVKEKVERNSELLPQPARVSTMGNVLCPNSDAGKHYPRQTSAAVDCALFRNRFRVMKMTVINA